jgi:ABC-2 type transport system ATP-binding protein
MRARWLQAVPPEELHSAAGGEDTIHVSVKGDPERVKTVLGALSGVRSVAGPGPGAGAGLGGRPGGGAEGFTSYTLKVADGGGVGEMIFRAAVQNGWTLNELRREALSLEDIFLKLTTAESEEGPGE